MLYCDGSFGEYPDEDELGVVDDVLKVAGGIKGLLKGRSSYTFVPGKPPGAFRGPAARADYDRRMAALRAQGALKPAPIVAKPVTPMILPPAQTVVTPGGQVVTVPVGTTPEQVAAGAGQQSPAASSSGVPGWVLAGAGVAAAVGLFLALRPQGRRSDYA